MVSSSRRRGAGSSITSVLIPAFIYCLSIGIYLHPLTSAPTPSESPASVRRWTLINDPAPQLDELHMISSENHDVSPQPTTSWTDAWSNDYWGRPLSSDSSHKSWRPVSIWSFRFVNGGRLGRWLIALAGRAIGGFAEGLAGMLGRGFGSGDGAAGEAGPASELFVHRFVNVLIHAALMQTVGAVAMLLFPRDPSSTREPERLQTCTKHLAQLLFALHPVHVEAVANMANRPHILALLLNATIVDPRVHPIVFLFLASLGLLTAETAIFQLPAVVLTMTAIHYRESYVCERAARDETKRRTKTQRSLLAESVGRLFPKYVLLVLTATTYLAYRRHNDTLSIPAGLIRPAENPFYDKIDNGVWTLKRRVFSYSYVLSLHLLKAHGVEVLGASHEYGFDCIPEIRSFQDRRLLLPAALLIVFEGVFAWALHGGRRHGGGRRATQGSKRAERAPQIMLVLVYFSWMASLFPISGVLKVGTLVADRIAMGSSFGACIFLGRVLAVWMVPTNQDGTNKDQRGKAQKSTAKIVLLVKVAIFSLLAMDFATRTHRRAAEWMDSFPLIESSLKTCPRSIKSNLEASKLYSGLVPHALDLERALVLIGTAQTLDPTYCDVHQQFSHVYFQQARYVEFEEEMVESLLCPYTMGQALGNWKKYWEPALQAGQGTDVRQRYEKHMARMKVEVQKEEAGRNGDRRPRGVKDEL